MQERTEAERYLVDEIRRGSSQAWSQLVDRYEGRLTAFARRRAPKGTEAEDLVQDTFLQFLRGLVSFRGEASLETFLFVILRRRLIDLHRGSAIKAAGDSAPPPETAAPDPTASWYVRRDEQRHAAETVLTTALRELVGKLQENLKFDELQIVELVFHAQWPNRQIAEQLTIPPEQVAMLKHRWLKQLRQRIEESSPQIESTPQTPAALDSLLTEIWEDQRPTCPKRSTIGGFLLGTLDEAWQKYIDFHIHHLQCPFCLANLEDLQTQNQKDPAPLRHRILESTVGFFRKP